MLVSLWRKPEPIQQPKAEKNIMVKAKQALQQQKQKGTTCSSDEAQGCLGAACPLWMFPKAVLIHRQHSFSCLLLCHFYCRLYSVTAKLCKQKKTTTQSLPHGFCQLREIKIVVYARCKRKRRLTLSVGKMVFRKNGCTTTAKSSRCSYWPLLTSCKASACGELHGWNQEKNLQGSSTM